MWAWLNAALFFLGVILLFVMGSKLDPVTSSIPASAKEYVNGIKFWFFWICIANILVSIVRMITGNHRGRALIWLIATAVLLMFVPLALMSPSEFKEAQTQQ